MLGRLSYLCQEVFIDAWQEDLDFLVWGAINNPYVRNLGPIASESAVLGVITLIPLKG